MIVEIQGVDEERMKKIEKILPLAGLSEITKLEEFDRKICVSADTGKEQWVNTYRAVWGFGAVDGIRVFLREPGELCVTIEGSRSWTSFIIGMLVKFDIPHIGVLALLLAEEHKKRT